MLIDEVRYFNNLFKQLEATSSTNLKRYYIKQMPPEYEKDWTFLLELITGKRKVGYKISYRLLNNGIIPDEKQNYTLQMYMDVLFEPLRQGNLSDFNVSLCLLKVMPIIEFIRPIVNRDLRLGIGNSLLDKPINSPMLANKYDGVIKMQSNSGYYITEKLDGNRCIAMYDFVEDKWKFYTRNGKEREYGIFMGDLPKEYIYDGEVMSRMRTEDSMLLSTYLIFKDTDITPKFKYKNNFNKENGQLNRKDVTMDVCYNVFDIIDDKPYFKRREILDSFAKEFASEKVKSSSVRIVPVLQRYNDRSDVYFYCDKLLDDVTEVGAEGLMINVGDAPYVNKRGNHLLKYKKQQTIDMKVISIKDGTGKYEGMVGAITCEATIDGPIKKYVCCDVGSGLSDSQRELWYDSPEDIIGKIVEIAYFDLSQNKGIYGSYTYSLRFPRLKSVRTDKDDNINI